MIVRRIVARASAALRVRRARRRLATASSAAALALMFAGVGEAQAQVSGVRSFDGGVGVLFNLVGPGSLYLDSTGTQGYIYSGSASQTFSFRQPNGQAWSGSQGTLGPQLSIGLIQGANQGSAPVVLPGMPRQPGALPQVQSTLLDLYDDIP